VNAAADEYGERDAVRIFEALDAHGVEYIVVGGSAAILWGADRATRDVDCVTKQSPENFERVCGALRSLGNPRLRIEGVDDETAAELSSQLLHPDFFSRTQASTWRTNRGSIDVLASIPNLDGDPSSYEELLVNSVSTPTGSIQIQVAALDDVIDSKVHANRAKDLEALPELHELRARLEANDGPGHHA